ncbi:hypothetical protein [Pseudomonas putida]|uniref:hypothetical protein n=1 Tax=Pseudomonas putida TaxID=303 RepID=UPI0039E0C639
MAGQWVPTNGVFWSTPPDDGLPFLRWAIVLLFATVAAAVVAVRIRKKCSEPQWHLRQHMVEVGAAVTLTYLVGITVLTWGRIGTLGDMPLNEVGDFLAGAFGPVAFLWLVLGFLQQGEELKQGTKALLLQATELKNSVQQQSIMAAAATQQIEAQHAALELQRSDREKSLLADFSIVTAMMTGAGAPGRVENVVNIRNDGNTAHNTVVRFDPPIGRVGEARLGEFKTGMVKDLRIRFEVSPDPVLGGVTVEYEDKEGHLRRDRFDYTLIDSSVAYSKIRTPVRFVEVDPDL